MSGLALYEISGNYRKALETLTDPQAELPQAAVHDTLEGIAGELQEKAVNVAKFMRNLEAAAQAIKEVEAQMARRRKTIETRAKWLKDYLKDNMEACGIEKIESPWFRLAVQNNPPAVEITDEEALPDEFKQKIVTVKVDKTAIKNAIKAGENIPGTVLGSGTRLVIR